jgi:hypothetical protein
MQVDTEADALIHKLIDGIRGLLGNDQNAPGYSQAVLNAQQSLQDATDAGFTQMEG